MITDYTIEITHHLQSSKINVMKYNSKNDASITCVSSDVGICNKKVFVEEFS